MMNLQDSSPTADHGQRSPFSFGPADQSLLPGVKGVAMNYRHPHSILGRREAAAYVQQLAAQARHSGEGWYAVSRLGEVASAAYLSVYGVGDGNGHTLWKIRHPLLDDGAPAACLRLLFNGLVAAALRARRGSAKFVVFLGEYEQNAMSQVSEAGFQREACFKDYYRLGETCFVYGRTAV
jgi:hypothetical protein